MKNQCLVVIMLISTYGQACPTCVGRVTKQSAPFFSNECYCSEKKQSNPDSSGQKNKHKTLVEKPPCTSSLRAKKNVTSWGSTQRKFIVSKASITG